MQGYDHPIQVTYTFPAQTVSGDAVIGNFQGPAGKRGRVLDISYEVTTDVTVAAATLNVGNTQDDAANAECTVAVGAAGTVGAATAAQLNPADTNFLAADTKAILASDGGATAGAADVHVTVGWF